MAWNARSTARPGMLCLRWPFDAPYRPTVHAAGHNQAAPRTPEESP